MKYLKYFEDIKIPIKVGDTVLGGRFKNKKIVVKKIGKNKKGDVTINGKPLLRFRVIKESIEESAQQVVDYYLSHLVDDGFDPIKFTKTGIPGDNNTRGDIKIWKRKHENRGYNYSNCEPYKLGEVSDDIYRFLKSSGVKLSFIYTVKMNSELQLLGSTSFSRREITLEKLMNNPDMEVLSIVIRFNK